MKQITEALLWTMLGSQIIMSVVLLCLAGLLWLVILAAIIIMVYFGYYAIKLAVGFLSIDDEIILK